MHQRIFLYRGVARRIVDVLPQENRSLQGLPLRRNFSGHYFHPQLCVRFLASFQKSIRSLLVILQVKIIDESQIFVEAPIIRIRLDAALDENDLEVRPSSTARWGLAQEHGAKRVGEQ